MSKEMDFFLYLIENYAYYKHVKANDIIKTLNELNLLNKIFNNYEFYHIEKLENAYQDIDRLIEEKSKI